MSLHFLPFGTVVRAKVNEQELDLMVVDWVVKPESGKDYDYLGVIWPRGFAYVEGDEKTYQKVPFNAEGIELVRFVGLSSCGFEERDNKCFDVAKEKGLSIARLFESGELHEFQTPSKTLAKKKLPKIGRRDGASDDYYPIGTVLTVNAEDVATGESQERDVMIVALGPDYLEGDVDYQIMPWKEGFCAVDFLLGINESDIVRVKSLGFINADVQFLVNAGLKDNAEGEISNA